jgi:hypothetical protein
MKLYRSISITCLVTFLLATFAGGCNFPLHLNPQNSSFDDATIMMIAARGLLGLYASPEETQSSISVYGKNPTSLADIAQMVGSKDELNEQRALASEYQRMADLAEEAGNQTLLDHFNEKVHEHTLAADQVEKRRADWRRNHRFFYVVKKGARAFGHAIGNIIDFAAQALISNIKHQIDFYVKEIKAFLANPIRYAFDLTLRRQLEIIKNQLNDRLGPFFGQRIYDLLKIDEKAWKAERGLFQRGNRKTPTADPKTPPMTEEQQPTPDPSEAGSESTTVVGDWHGAACDEAEGTYQYRWSVNLIQDPETDQIIGTIKFHACPGGGRVLYRVIGEPQTDPVLTLTGIKNDGAGDLFTNSPDSIEFTFDTSKGKISPNLSQ